MSNSEVMDWSPNATCAFDVVAREFVVVTADGADLHAFSPLCALLRRVHRAFGLEAAFISEGSGGETVVRRRAEADDHECDPLQSLFGYRLLAADAGGNNCFDAVPVITSDGVEHGTLCCRTGGLDSDDSPDREALRSVARLIADWFEDADLSLSGFAPLAGSSVMGSLAY